MLYENIAVDKFAQNLEHMQELGALTTQVLLARKPGTTYRCSASEHTQLSALVSLPACFGKNVYDPSGTNDTPRVKVTP